MRRLERLAFTYAPAVVAGAAVRQIVEVFPHPAMIGLIGLQRTLKYKARPKRCFDERLSEWRRYQAYISDLVRADPPLHGQEAFIARDVTQLTGRRLKDYEDQVDALICAYIALYAFRWGEARCHVFGTLDEGSIFTPVREEMLVQLRVMSYEL